MAQTTVVADLDQWLSDRGLKPMGGGLPQDEVEPPPPISAAAQLTPFVDPVRLEALRLAAEIARGWPSECQDEIVGLAKQFHRFMLGEDETE